MISRVFTPGHTRADRGDGLFGDSETFGNRSLRLPVFAASVDLENERFGKFYVSPVPTLSDAIRPSDVSGFVTAIVIDPVDSHSCRPFADIGEEVFEHQPAFTYRDSATAVVLERTIVGIETSRLHPAPIGVGTCAAHSVCRSRAVPSSTKPEIHNHIMAGVN